MVHFIYAVRPIGGCPRPFAVVDGRRPCSDTFELLGGGVGFFVSSCLVIMFLIRQPPGT